MRIVQQKAIAASVQVNDRAQNNSFNSDSTVNQGFTILDHLEKLTPHSKEKDCYICPVCGDDNLKINPKTGAYKCFSTQCTSEDIRNVIAPLAPQEKTYYRRQPAKRKSKKEKQRDVTLATTEVEMKARELALSVEGGYETPRTAQVNISEWAKEHGHNVYAAQQLLKEFVKQLPGNGTEKKTIAQLLLDIAAEATYFRTPDQKVHADIWADGIRKTHLTRRKAFKQWLQYELFKRHQKTVGSETLNQVLNVVEAKANFEGEVREVHLRVAAYEDKVYLDLGTEDWCTVEVSAEGWQITANCPVRFRRPNTLLPLPFPESGGNLAELRQLLNLDNDAWVLFLSWLLFSFYPKYPHPILILHGEQGSGKSCTAKVLRALIDPGKAPLIPNVADLRNLAIAAENRWILAYDNLSILSAEQSDALCRISTGGGFSIRTLYENDEETVFEFIRPQMLTGIDSLATRGDLLERSLLVKLPTISEDQRVTEAQLEAKLNQLQGRILGALLTALSQTLKNLPQTNPERLPRMADFARFAIAAETALDLPEGSFLKAYLGNRQEAQETALEASPVATAIQRLMSACPQWKGTATDLLEALEKLVDENTVKSKAWTGNSKSLGKALTRLAPDLRGIGIEVTMKRSNSHRHIQIDRTTNQTSLMSLMSQPVQTECLSDDICDNPIVMETQGNVTCDKSQNRDWQTSQQSTPNVTLETAIQQMFQQNSDNCDMSDKNNVSSSTPVGKKVKKRGKLGWFGIVQSVQGGLAEVLWECNQYPVSVQIDELEEIA